jgi:hypothetical protein
MFFCLSLEKCYQATVGSLKLPELMEADGDVNPTLNHTLNSIHGAQHKHVITKPSPVPSRISPLNLPLEWILSHLKDEEEMDSIPAFSYQSSPPNAGKSRPDYWGGGNT